MHTTLELVEICSFHFFAYHWPGNLCKWASTSKYPTRVTNRTIYGCWEQFTALEMAISSPRNGQKNGNFAFFSISFHFFAYHWPGNLCKWATTLKYPIRVTTSTIYGCWEQFTALEMAISSPRNGQKSQNIWSLPLTNLNLSQMPKYGALWTLWGAFQYALVFLNVCWCFESH